MFQGLSQPDVWFTCNSLYSPSSTSAVPPLRVRMDSASCRRGMGVPVSSSSIKNSARTSRMFAEIKNSMKSLGFCKSPGMVDHDCGIHEIHPGSANAILEYPLTTQLICIDHRLCLSDIHINPPSHNYDPSVTWGSPHHAIFPAFITWQLLLLWDQHLRSGVRYTETLGWLGWIHGRKYESWSSPEITVQEISIIQSISDCQSKYI